VNAAQGELHVLLSTPDVQRLTVASRSLTPGRWTELEVPLGAWSGRSIVLELEADVRGETGGGWAMSTEPVLSDTDARAR
jgi:hypothetical protein